MVNNQANNTPKVSIIIPVYNTEKYLKECLDSVINQTLKEIEIICIDDNSSDNSLQILKEYAQKDNRIKIIENKSNLGAGPSRNKGIKLAKGEYIGFLDSDDFIDLNYFKILYNAVKKYNVDVVQCDNIYRYYDLNDIMNQKQIWKTKNNNQLISINKENITSFQWYLWSHLYRREFYNSLNIIQPHLFAQDLFINQIIFSYLFEQNKKMFITNDTIYYYRKSNKTSTTNSRMNNTTNEIKILELIYNNYKNRNLLDKLPIPITLKSMLYRSSIKEQFFQESKQFFLKIKKDNLIDKNLYKQEELDFINNCIIHDNYKSYIDTVSINQKQFNYLNVNNLIFAQIILYVLLFVLIFYKIKKNKK